MEPRNRKVILRSQEKYFYGAHPGMNFKTLSFINVNVDCFCSQYIFLNTIRRTIFQVWGLYHMALFGFCRHKKLWESWFRGSTFPPPFFLVYNLEVAKLLLYKHPKIFTFGPMSIKKFCLLRIAFWSFTGKVIFASASQWISTFQLYLYQPEQEASGQPKDGVCFHIKKIFISSYCGSHPRINFLKIS